MIMLNSSDEFECQQEAQMQSEYDDADCVEWWQTVGQQEQQESENVSLQSD